MKRSASSKRRIVGRAGKFGLKGPMARQSPSSAERPDEGRKTKIPPYWAPRGM